MKPAKIIIASFLMLIGLHAKAQYRCTSPNNDEVVEVYKQATRVGNTIVTLAKDGKVTQYYGNQTTEGQLFSETIIDFFFVDGYLTISKYPKQCGRGSCLPGGGSYISAMLTVNGEESFFSCDEIFN